MKKYKPTSAGRRGMTVVSYKKKLTTSKNAPHKSLTKGMRSTGGRNSQGRITTHYRGGGNKRTYRVIDFKFDKKDVPAKIESIEYDPYRSGFVALVCYKDGERRYILAPKGMKKGEFVDFLNLGWIPRYLVINEKGQITLFKATSASDNDIYEALNKAI